MWLTLAIVRVFSLWLVYSAHFSLVIYKPFHLSETDILKSLEDTFESALKARYRKMIMMDDFDNVWK